MVSSAAKKLALISIIVMVLSCTLVLVEQGSEELDAASYGTPTNPRTSVSLTWANVYNNNYTEIYVVTGSSFSITHTSSYECFSMTDEQGYITYSSAWGLTISSTGNLTGTVSGTGSTQVTYNDVSGGIAVDYHVTVYIVQGSTPTGQYAQTVYIGNWDYWRYLNWDPNDNDANLNNWSNAIYSDSVINIPSGNQFAVRWYCYNEHPLQYNECFMGQYSDSMYGSPIGYAWQVTAEKTYYPAYKMVEVTIYNNTSVGGAASAILFSDDWNYGAFVWDIQQNTSEVVYFPSNKTIELAATPYYPGVFKNWSIRSGTTSTSNPWNYSLGAYDRIIDVVWDTPQPYTVNFNANGGSVSPTSKSVYFGSTYGNLPVPTRQGYGFDGWFTAATGGTQVTASTSVPWKSQSQSTYSIYAHWTANTYTVTFDASTNHGTPNSTKSVTYGSTYGTLPTATSQISGYSFAGWFTAATGGTQITPNTQVPYSSTGTITVYAQFTQITHTVTIQASTGGTATIYETNNPSNTATAQSGRTATITVVEGNGVTMTATPDGSHHFVDWRSSVSPSTSILSNPYSYSNVRADITFTANFGNGAEHTVTFDYWTNGGTGVSFPSKTVINGQAYGELPVAIKEGMEFNGWFTAATGGTKITTTTTVNLSADQTLYAQFVNNPLMVTISINYGTATVTDGTQTISVSGGASPVSMTTRERTVTVTATPGSGYNFNYWNYFWNGDTSSPGGYENDNPWTLTLMGNVEIFGICSQVIISKPYYAYVNDNSYGTISDGTSSGTYLSGTVNVGDVVSISNNAITIGSVTVTATPNTNYEFVSWTGVTDGQVVQNSDANITFTANFSSTLVPVPYYASVNDSRYGIISNGSSSGATVTGNVYVGDRIQISDNVATIGRTTFIATPMPGYEFTGWSGITNNSIVRDTMDEVVFSAIFSPPLNVWWFNGYANGSVEIVFDFTGLSDSSYHKLVIPMWEFNGAGTSLENDPHGLLQFSSTPYTLVIENGYNTDLRVSVLNGDTVVKGPISFTVGNWQQYALEIDAQKGIVTFKGIHNILDRITQPFSFVNYTVTYIKVAADVSDVINGMAIEKIFHEDNNGTVNPHFQVSRTTTYLNTYGFVMTDPSINIIEQFPNYDDLRLNFYSFAYYGDSVTINNHTMQVQNADIVLYYIPKGTPIYDPGHSYIVSYYDRNVISTQGNPDAKELRTPLSNIYITWNGIQSQVEEERVCSLTFVDSKMTIDMGNFQPHDLTVSFTGVWYFTTALYEPYTATETSYEMDWWDLSSLDRNGFILVFDLIILIGYIVANRIYVPGFMDKCVVIGALVFSFVLLAV